MLTYEQKRSLLEAKLNELLCKKEDEEDCCCYCWVCDLDDVNVYYHYNEAYYKAVYSINEEDSSVEISTGEAIQVTRSWQEFAAEEDESDNKKECSKDCEPDNKEQECGTQCSEQECGTQCSESNEGVDGEIYNEDSDDEEDDDKKDSDEDEDKDKEEEYIDGVNVYNDYSLEIKQYGENEEAIKVAFKATEENYAQFNEAYSNIIEVVNKLQSEYAEIESKYNDMLIAQQNATLYNYGENLLNSEEDLEVDNYKALIAEFKSKCDNSEFTSEDDVSTYVENQIAKTIYKQIKNNKEKNNEQKNFSAKLKSTNTVEVQEVAEDSMAKMKKILKY